VGTKHLADQAPLRRRPDGTRQVVKGRRIGAVRQMAQRSPVRVAPKTLGIAPLGAQQPVDLAVGVPGPSAPSAVSNATIAAGL